MLGEILNNQQNRPKTIAYFQELTRQAPKLPRPWGVLGMNLLDSGRKAEGLAAIRKWTELEPDSMTAWDTYAQAMTRTGDYDGAGRATERSSGLESLFFKLRYAAPKRD